MRVSVETTPGPIVHINCPKCGARGVPSTTLDQVETMSLVIHHRTSWVKCGNCGKTLLSNVPVGQLATLTPEQIEPLIGKQYPRGLLYLNLTAIFFCWVPFVGAALMALCVYLNRKHKAWMWTCIVGLVVAIVCSIYILAWMKPESRSPGGMRPGYRG